MPGKTSLPASTCQDLDIHTVSWLGDSLGDRADGSVCDKNFGCSVLMTSWSRNSGDAVAVEAFGHSDCRSSQISDDFRRTILIMSFRDWACGNGNTRKFLHQFRIPYVPSRAAHYVV